MNYMNYRGELKRHKTRINAVDSQVVVSDFFPQQCLHVSPLGGFDKVLCKDIDLLFFRVI